MKHLFCPKCKKITIITSYEENIIKFCRQCGTCLYTIKSINGTEVDNEELS